VARRRRDVGAPFAMRGRGFRLRFTYWGRSAAPMLQAPVDHAARRRRVTDGVEGTVVGNDLQHIAGHRPAEPAARRHCDPEIAPVTHALRWRAMDELRADGGEPAPELLSDRTPVADRR